MLTDSHVSGSQEWLKSIDRGELTDITDEAFQTFDRLQTWPMMH